MQGIFSWLSWACWWVGHRYRSYLDIPTAWWSPHSEHTNWSTAHPRIARATVPQCSSARHCTMQRMARPRRPAPDTCAARVVASYRAWEIPMLARAQFAACRRAHACTAMARVSSQPISPAGRTVWCTVRTASTPTPRGGVRDRAGRRLAGWPPPTACTITPRTPGPGRLPPAKCQGRPQGVDGDHDHPRIYARARVDQRESAELNSPATPHVLDRTHSHGAPEPLNPDRGMKAARLLACPKTIPWDFHAPAALAAATYAWACWRTIPASSRQAYDDLSWHCVLHGGRSTSGDCVRATIKRLPRAPLRMDFADRPMTDRWPATQFSPRFVIWLVRLKTVVIIKTKGTSRMHWPACM